MVDLKKTFFFFLVPDFNLLNSIFDKDKGHIAQIQFQILFNNSISEKVSWVG